MSGRTLARTPLGGGFSTPPFRLRGGVHSSAIGHVSSVPPKIPYVRFSRVRLQASGTHDEFGTWPSAEHLTLKADPAMPVSRPAFATSFGRAEDPDLRTVTAHRLRQRFHLGHLSPEALARGGLCCPTRQRLVGLIHQSGELHILSLFRLWIRSLTFKGHIILSVLLTFRTFTAEPSRIATVYTSGDPMRAPQFFRTGSGHRVATTPLASTIFFPPVSFQAGPLFRRFRQTFAFAAALRFARHPS